MSFKLDYFFVIMIICSRIYVNSLIKSLNKNCIKQKRPLINHLKRRSLSTSFDYRLYCTDKNENDATVIDGKATAARIRSELALQITQLKDNFNAIPGLAVVLVGERRDSSTYVRMKKRACDEVGIASYDYNYSVDVTEEELISTINELNQDEKIHGILVQLPLPLHIIESNVLNSILPEKDVDGLHPINIHNLASTGTRIPGKTTFSFDSVDYHVSCTPQGCVELLDRYDIEIAGKNAVVVGRSNIVGVPLALLLMKRDATVTIAHSKSIDLPSIVSRADIVIAACGRANMVTSDMIKDDAVVIDVGINSVEDSTDKRGYKLIGDVDYDNVKSKASYITPVPGGVGPMTIAMLLRNTFQACRRSVMG